jgi:syntaxin 1B/2/3
MNATIFVILLDMILALQNGRQQDPNAILNECSEIGKGIDSIVRNLGTIQKLQESALRDPDSSQQSATNNQLNLISSQTIVMYRSFAARSKTLKQQPESGSPKNVPQLGMVDRKLKDAINQYQNIESEFRKKLEVQMTRQYNIVMPNATEAEVEAEVRKAVPNQQIFSEALLQSDRRGPSSQALSSVQNRHATIQNIESQMTELAQLFHDIQDLVVQQEDSVTMIEQKGEDVQENLDKGNEHIGVAIKSARSRNRKKWYCLGIVRTYHPSTAIQTTTKTPQSSSLSSSSSSPSSPPSSSTSNTRATTTTTTTTSAASYTTSTATLPLSPAHPAPPSDPSSPQELCRLVFCQKTSFMSVLLAN